MSRRTGSWLGGLLLGNSEEQELDRFSIEHLRHLREVLIRNPVVTDANRDAIVETLRSIAELMVWGDQHDPKFLDYFLENNILQHFTHILQQRSNRRGEVAVQVLQTLSMLIQNIQSKTAIFYLFSNNHINEVVGMRFDFENEEVLGHYITLLKSISLKLNNNTVQFFFSNGLFPLYTEAVKLINHRDGMVRTAVRTLTLKVYHIRDPAVQTFVISQPANHYFTRLASYVADQCQVLDDLLSLLGGGSSTAIYNVDSCLAEVEDLLSYCNDILSAGANGLASLVLQCLWESFALPVIVEPLVTAVGSNQHNSQPQQVKGTSKLVHPVCALHVLERLLHVMSYTPFVDLLVSLLCRPPQTSMNVSPDATPSASDQASDRATDRVSSGHSASTSQPGSSPKECPKSPARNHAEAAPAADGVAGRPPPQPSPWLDLFALHEHSLAYRECFLAVLHGEDSQLTAAAVRALVAVVQSKAVSENVLAACGLLPVRRRRHQVLMDALVGGERSDPASLFGSPRSSSQSSSPERDTRRPHRRFPVPSSPSRNGSSSPSPQSPRHQQHPSDPPDPDTSYTNGFAQHKHHHQRTQGPLQQDGDDTRQHEGQVEQHAEASGQCVDALFGVLLQPLLPSTCLWHIGWLLSHLLAHAQSASSQLLPHQQRLLDQAAEMGQAGLVENLQGMWCDAVAVLVGWEWPHARRAIWQAGTASTAAAVQAWLQAIQVQELAQMSPGRDGSPQRGALSANAVSLSAEAAKHVLQSVHTFVALTQIQQILHTGEIGEQAPIPAVTESVLRSSELREGTTVSLDQQVTCSVAFAKGQERRVFFAIQGLPQADRALQGAAAQAALATAAATTVASVVLADPGQHSNAGTVLSLAPLLGANPEVDRSHPRWLHVHVRPHVRGLLKLLKGSSHGTVLMNIGRQLVDGHWVLSFATPQQAQYAQDMVVQHTARLRTLHGEAMLPMLTSSRIM
ncbi:hypothetical protein WJX77_007106 [Trebouxia sp. C0004]